ncbi:M35 family metallo-endopeptidase [Frateuria hangzhouensis]|uniref:M35 family metallo-endopeptidase n=1 Tax=Frateuria hangzhouensis TaxID=2995589 RepID=UPI002260DE23|nr:M35 family metallo-endopeptidase [Frateuria sp. STR12]MCX7514326.1 M35 family metallo-endopeptidase [Frateuria sp. STR12]
MVDWNKTFKAEYDYARSWLKSDQRFARHWQPLVRDLQRLMSDDGFDAGRASVLSDLRKKSTQGEGSLLGHKKVTPDRGLLEAVGAWSDDGAGLPDDTQKMRAAALKLLSHTYLLNRSGSRKVWIVSMPNDFVAWPSDDINARSPTQIALRILLRSSEEVFSQEQKKYLAVSTQQAMAWCQKAGIVLASAAKAASGKAGGKGVDAINLVKRWFADPATSVVDLQAYIDRLSIGLKAIIAMLNRGHFVLTDWIPLRTASTQDEINFLMSEAFTFPSRGEGMDTVYIERSFFTHDAGGVVHGQKNWTRVLVHELTHLVCGTEDVNIGRARYAHYGIGPHAGFPGSAAIRNADSWAFFLADCAGALTDGERNHALKII